MRSFMCGNSYVETRMWKLVCGNSYVDFHLRKFTCGILYASFRTQPNLSDINNLTKCYVARSLYQRI
jgi:hypothetical protein